MRLDAIVQTWMRREAHDRSSLKCAQQLIRGGAVAVDGVVRTEPKYQIVTSLETVSVSEGGCGASRAGCMKVEVEEQPLYVMHKPAGVISQRHPREANVYDLVPEGWRRPDLAAFGRLDVDTTGVLLFGTGVQKTIRIAHSSSHP